MKIFAEPTALKTGVVSIGSGNSIDWNVIQAKYVGGMSIYQLSKDYGLSTSTIHKRAKRGEWEKERERTAKEARKKTIEKAAKAAADNATIAANIRRKGLLILDRLYDQFMEMDCTEQRTSVDGVTKAMRLKDLTAAYKDLTGDMVTAEAQSNPLLQSLYELEKRLDHD